MNDKVTIKRLKVDHYGPLSDIDLEMTEGLNAFYGGNESGKTLLVESITKMLLEDPSKFKGIGRVSQRPNGLLTVSNGKKEFDASQEGLKKVFGDVTAEDVRNAFIIRDFDLRLPERENDFGNGDYFKDVTDRILGSKTQKVEALREEISDIGYLTNATSNSKLENTKGTGKLRDKKERTEKLRDEIDEFMEKVEEEGLFRKYSRVDSLENQIGSKESEIAELKNAEKQKKYEKGQSLLEDLRKAEEDLKDLEREKKEFEELKEIRKKAESFELEASPGRESKLIAAGSGVVSLAGFGAVSLNPLPVIVGGAVVALLVSAYFAEKYRKNEKVVKSQERKEEEILEEAEAKDIRASTLPEVVDAVDKYERDLEEREKEIRDRKREAIGQLKGLFNAGYEDPEDWRKEIENFSNSFESVERGFDDGDLEEAEEELEELEKEKEGLESEIDQYDEILTEFDSGVSQAVDGKFVEGGIVDISSVEDLNRASRQLENFISALEENVQASKNAIKVLEEIEEEEEDEFNRIFNEDSYAVEMFRKATDGNYTDIRYDKEDRELKVIRVDGTPLEPEALSQGTYDLLYMSVRLKLAREILGEPGFLVLDNAFVHSDTERIKKELDFMKELEEEGWQIIYFTFRSDVREVLEEEVEVRELDGLDF
jgi:uncharacterized protein YhaN